MTLVDIVVPAFNPGRYLALALRSVIAQTFEDWRAVIVDDGSTQDLSWVNNLDPRITMLRQANRGASRARNSGIAAGSSPFVAFLDSDDLWLPRKLDLQLEAMTEVVGLCSTAMDLIDADGTVIGPGFQGHSTSRGELLQGNGICTSTVLMRRELLDQVGLFDPELQQAHDWDLWLRAAARADLIKVPQVLTHYRIHDTNISRNYLRFRRESTVILRRHATGSDHRLARVGRRRVAELAGAQAFDAFRATRSPQHLFWALRLNPAYAMRAILSYLLKRP